MKKAMLVTVLMLLCAAIAFGQTDSTKTDEKTATIKITVVGLDSNDGAVMCALANSQENYKVKGKPFKGKKTEIKDKKAIIVFENIPYGTYAFKLFHDEDGDGKMTMNWIGMPSEDYGFSNNATGSMGPADWKDAKFEVNKPVVEQKISVD